MGPRRIPALLIAGFLIAGGALGQQATSPPLSKTSTTKTLLPPWTQPQIVRDPQALGVVQASITAMGGAAAISAVQSCVVNIQADESAISGPTGPEVLTVSGANFRTDFQGPNGLVTLSTGNGAAFRTIQGNTTTVSQWVIRAQFLPVLTSSILTKEFQDPNYSFEYKGTSTLGAEPVIVVATVSEATQIDSLVTPQTWYFDSSSSLPVRVEYRLPDNSSLNHSLSGAANVSGYQSVSGVLYPFQVSLSLGKNSLGSRTVTSVQPNAGVAASEFASPSGVTQ